MNKSWSQAAYEQGLAGLQVDAVTGGYACGKSTVLEELKRRGFPVIDADKVGHEFLLSPNPVYHRILARFGADLVDKPGGPINRAKLRERAFGNPETKKELESMVLPSISQRIQEYICTFAQHGHRRIFVEVPLLFESGLHRRYSRILCISARPEIQLRNAMARNNLTREEAEARINMQWPLKYKEHLSDYVIDNSGTKEETFAQLDAYLKQSEIDAQQVVAAGTNNREYRRTISRLARLATSHILEKMGDLAGVSHKDGAAEISMKVSVSSPDSHGKMKESAHQLKVNVNVCVGSVPPACELPNHSSKVEPCPPGRPQPPCPPPAEPKPPCPPDKDTAGGAHSLCLLVCYILFLLAVYWIVNRPQHLPNTSLCVSAVSTSAISTSDIACDITV